MPPEPPKPPWPPDVNVGLIVDVPTLWQSKPPPLLLATVESTLLPASPQQGQIAFTFVGGRQLMQSQFTGGLATKVTTFHYSPADPGAQLAAVEDRIEALEAKVATARTKPERDSLKDGLKTLEAMARKLRKDAKAGVAAPRLGYTTFVESAPGEVAVSGQTAFQYEGLDIVKAITTSETDEDPPQVDRMEYRYEYDALGRLAAMDAGGQITRVSYDPFGKPVGTRMEFLSPAGDFLSFMETTYAYAPPGMDPVPANGLLSAVTTAYSGPASAFGQSPAAPVPPPPKPPPGFEQPPPPPLKPETTTVTGNYVYA